MNRILGKMFSFNKEEKVQISDQNNGNSTLSSLIEESKQIKEQISILEKKLEDVNNKIAKLKKNEQINSLNGIKNQKVDETPTIIPKSLTISGYEDSRSVLILHFRDFFRYKTLSDPYQYYYSHLGYNLGTDNWVLSKIGKEIVFLKNYEYDSSEIEKTKSLIATCEKAIQQLKANDLIGYQKYLDLINSKFPIPPSPFQEEKPTDFFQDINSPLYVNAYHYLYFMSSYIDVFMDARKHELSNRGWVPIPEGININEYFSFCLRTFCDLAINGLSLAIIPVCDENIMYRSQKMAQEDNYISFYYYDDYVEDPQMVEIPKKLEFIESQVEAVESTIESSSIGNVVNNLPVSSYHGGSCWVSTHYRKGHWRNGSYVSGGYVRGHYRR